MQYWQKKDENSAAENAYRQNEQNLGHCFVEYVENAFIFTFDK